MTPEICDRILYNDRKYRVDGYVREYDPIAEMPEPQDEMDRITQDVVVKMINKEKEEGTYRTRYIWCEKEDATHVTGSGVAGCLAPISEVKIIGKVEWSEEAVQHQIDSHRRLIGETLR